MKKSPIRRLSSEEMKRVVGGDSVAPCFGEGNEVGRHYGQEHISAQAKGGGFIGQLHKPGPLHKDGGHHGFSVCL